VLLPLSGFTIGKLIKNDQLTHKWHGSYAEFWAFPSFHAADSWVLATSITRFYLKKLGITCYSLATSVSLSRVYLEEH